jgi:IPT/TIG domain/NHL repeat
MPAVPCITSLRPLWALEGGRLTICGEGFRIDPELPEVTIGEAPARVVRASPRALTVLVPQGLRAGRHPVRVAGLAGETPLVDVAGALATDLHQVDSPAYDADGTLVATVSGSRGQQGPVALYRVTPDGSRTTFIGEDLPNPTSLAFDERGTLYVTSRFEGSLYRVTRDGEVSVVASELGTPCGLAFGPDHALYVGDRSGSILRIAAGRAVQFASLPPSVVAYHLAFGPDGRLYVSAPTLASSESLYRIGADGQVSRFGPGFGRPQGLAFDDQGRLYVADSLAGGSGGLYRLDPATPDAPPERLIAAGGILGIAFDPRGGLALATAETVFRLEVPLRGRLPRVPAAARA